AQHLVDVLLEILCGIEDFAGPEQRRQNAQGRDLRDAAAKALAAEAFLLDEGDHLLQHGKIPVPAFHHAEQGFGGGERSGLAARRGAIGRISCRDVDRRVAENDRGKRPAGIAGIGRELEFGPVHNSSLRRRRSRDGCLSGRSYAPRALPSTDAMRSGRGELLQSRAMSDTIFALASAPGKAGVAVIRVSGPGAAAALRDLAGSVPAPRFASRRRLRDPDTSETIDDGIALYFKAPASYTGEDVAEFHLHGGCAFLNGKLDLTEAEAVADLVAAETAAQRRQALRQLDGEFGRRCAAWRERL